jgi:diguanylate cyclase (GGDEF)-like protein
VPVQVSPAAPLIKLQSKTVALDLLELIFSMKPLKKSVQSSPEILLASTTHKLFKRTLKKKAQTKNGRTSPGRDQREIFVISSEDIPPEELSKLLHSRKGITVNPGDNLLKRLLKLEKENLHLKSLSITDELTGLYNKRFFNKQLKIEITRTKRTGQPFCLIFIDLDNFKSINDTLGHAKGDEFLVNLCRLIGQKTRPTDFACRYGGDEFTIIMPATFLLDGISIAQRWHDLIKKMASQMAVDVSSSIGIDEYDESCTMTAEEFLDKVDKELYNAKRNGKNKVSYPGIFPVRKTKTRSVTPDEKDALFKASVSLTKKGKQLSAKV